MDQGRMFHKQSNTLSTHLSHPQTLAIHLWNGKWLCYEGVFLRIWSLLELFLFETCHNVIQNFLRAEVALNKG